MVAKLLLPVRRTVPLVELHVFFETLPLALSIYGLSMDGERRIQALSKNNSKSTLHMQSQLRSDSKVMRRVLVAFGDQE